MESSATSLAGAAAWISKCQSAMLPIWSSRRAMKRGQGPNGVEEREEVGSVADNWSKILVMIHDEHAPAVDWSHPNRGIPHHSWPGWLMCDGISSDIHGIFAFFFLSARPCADECSWYPAKFCRASPTRLVPCHNADAHTVKPVKRLTEVQGPSWTCSMMKHKCLR